MLRVVSLVDIGVHGRLLFELHHGFGYGHSLHDVFEDCVLQVLLSELLLLLGMNFAVQLEVDTF